MVQNPHYQAIRMYYGDRRAERSRVPLIAHIDEGLLVLDAIGAEQAAKDAFCLHPLVQTDDALEQAARPGSVLRAFPVEPIVVALAMEYRAVANLYLSRHCVGSADVIALSPIAAVNHMLVADKIQNRKDFERYHQESHPNAATLTQYFANWLRVLGVSESRYQALTSLLDTQLPSDISSVPSPFSDDAGMM